MTKHAAARSRPLGILDLSCVLQSNQAIKRAYVHLVLGFFAATGISCLVVTFLNGYLEQAFMLVIFNFIFVFITFPLDGKLSDKLCLLAIGNLIGFVCNFGLSLLMNYVRQLDESFSVLYLMLGPVANVVWIVSYWSMSLAFLSVRSRNNKQGANLC